MGSLRPIVIPGISVPNVRIFLAALSLLLTPVVAPPAQAQIFGSNPSAALSDANENVFFFGGAFHSGSFFNSGFVWALDWDQTYNLGVGYQNYFYRSDWSFQLGAEIGASARIDFNGQSSAEAWAGFVVRHDGPVFFDTIRISPSLTVGFSVASAPIGSEADRFTLVGTDTPFLIFLGPELAVTHADHPEFEGFMRVQHRSGAFGYVIDGLNGSNSVNLGFRLKY
jgi:hypothetical protein